MRPWFIVSTLALAGVRAQQNPVSKVPSSCSTICAVLSSLGSADPVTMCSGDVRDNLQRCMNCIVIIGGNSITPDLMASGQGAANAFTTACGSASFKLDPILVQNPGRPTTAAGGKKNGVSRVAAVEVSGLAFVWGVTMLLL